MRRPQSPEQVRAITRVDGAVMRKPSEQEMHDRRLFVRQLHAMGMPPSEIISQATEPYKDGDVVRPPRFDCSAQSVRLLIAEVRADLRVERELFAPSNQAAALERLYTHVLRLNTELQLLRNAAKRDYAAIRAHAAEVRNYEKLIAEMEGTLKPVKVEHVHGMTDTLTRVLSTMTPELTEQAIREEQQRERDARSITTTADAPPSLQPQVPAPGRRPRQPVPPSGERAVLDSAEEAPATAAPKREWSSVVAARREVRSPMDSDVGGRPGPGGIGARVVP